MANLFPTSLNNYITGANSVTLFTAGHAAAHNAYEAKIGTGSSTPVINTVLRGNGTGTSTWAQVALGTDITGTLIVANGGTGAITLTGVVIGNGTSAFTTVTAPSGAIVGTTDTQTLSGKTLTTPVIASFYQDAGLTKLMTVPSVSSDTLVVLTASQTLTNKRITKRVLSLSANSATPAINTDTSDVVHITSQTAAITSFTTNLTGTPVDGDTLRISITGTGAVSLTWGASFEASTIALPTTTVSTNRLDVGFFWNTETSKWRCVASA